MQDYDEELVELVKIKGKVKAQSCQEAKRIREALKSGKTFESGHEENLNDAHAPQDLQAKLIERESNDEDEDEEENEEAKQRREEAFKQSSSLSKTKDFQKKMSMNDGKITADMFSDEYHDLVKELNQKAKEVGL